MSLPQIEYDDSAWLFYNLLLVGGFFNGLTEYPSYTPMTKRPWHSVPERTGARMHTAANCF